MKKIVYLIAIGLLWSCNQPKRIESSSSEPSIFDHNHQAEITEKAQSQVPMPGTQTAAINQVMVKEQLPTSKYIYLFVQNLQSKKEYWIATRLQEIKDGGIYFYKDGLLKTNFESKEFDRVFDEIYLVNKLVAADHSQNTMQEQTISNAEKVTLAAGSTPIAEIVKNPEAFAGKTVQVTGICTKINPNIMNRNWIHLQDNSGSDYDFVLTSDQMVPEGHKVTMSGVLAVNKDFGAGYKYEMILENCTIVL